MDATAVLTGQMWSSNNSEKTKCDRLTVGESTNLPFGLTKKPPLRPSPKLVFLQFNFNLLPLHWGSALK